MNFVNEADNARRADANFEHVRTSLYIPKVLVAKPRVLIMELIRGGRVDDLRYLAEHKIDRNSVALELSRASNVYTGHAKSRRLIIVVDLFENGSYRRFLPRGLCNRHSAVYQSNVICRTRMLVCLAGASSPFLLTGMCIGRQSFYQTFTTSLKIAVQL
jgi:hypothetical protein